MIVLFNEQAKGGVMHMKEPWRIGLCGGDAETNPIESDDGFVHITDAHPDDARRIVACVNACEGIPTDVLENVIAGRMLIGSGVQLWMNYTDKKAEVEELKQQRDELQRDAERYRWLRSQPLNDSYPVGWYVLKVKTSGGKEIVPARNLEDLDAAIDSAMKEQK